jgi:hypothetical protein
VVILTEAGPLLSMIGYEADDEMEVMVLSTLEEPVVGIEARSCRRRPSNRISPRGMPGWGMARKKRRRRKRRISTTCSLSPIVRCIAERCPARSRRREESTDVATGRARSSFVEAMHGHTTDIKCHCLLTLFMLPFE